MTQIELDQLIMIMCKKAGLNKNIDISYAAKIGSQLGGEWDFDWRQKGEEGLLVSITYWHNSFTPDTEDIFLSWDALNTEEQQAIFIDSVAQKIDEIKIRIEK